MKRILLYSFVCTISLLLFGCMTTPVEDSGGIGSVLVPNTNVNALITASQSVFAQYGYQIGPVNYPNSISFDKPAGGFGKLMYGGYDQTTTIRVKMVMMQVPGSNDYKLATRVSRVTNAGEAGFEDNAKMLGLWSGEFKPLLQQVKTQSAGAGSGL